MDQAEIASNPWKSAYIRLTVFLMLVPFALMGLVRLNDIRIQQRTTQCEKIAAGFYDCLYRNPNCGKQYPALAAQIREYERKDGRVTAFSISGVFVSFVSPFAHVELEVVRVRSRRRASLIMPESNRDFGWEEGESDR